MQLGKEFNLKGEFTTTLMYKLSDKFSENVTSSVSLYYLMLSENRIGISRGLNETNCPHSAKEDESKILERD